MSCSGPQASLPALKPRIYTRAMNQYRRLGWYLPGVPTAIRWTLMLQARRDRARVARESAGQEASIEAWLSQHHLFFGFGLFRSGTTFLSHALDTLAHGAQVRHEPNVCDYISYADVLTNPGAAGNYLRPYRLAETWVRMRSINCSVYGEVNPYLRRHAGALRVALPAAPMFHLVRDGRGVVRSLLSRELFARHDPMAALIRPPVGDAYAPRWASMSRFEKLCWLWQADNRYLRQTVDRVVQFERLLDDYQYLCERVLAHIGLDISADSWALATQSIVNPTPGYTAAAWQNWPAGQREAFERICGQEMAACGYVR